MSTSFHSTIRFDCFRINALVIIDTQQVVAIWVRPWPQKIFHSWIVCQQGKFTSVCDSPFRLSCILFMIIVFRFASQSCSNRMPRHTLSGHMDVQRSKSLHFTQFSTACEFSIISRRCAATPVVEFSPMTCYHTVAIEIIRLTNQEWLKSAAN